MFVHGLSVVYHPCFFLFPSPLKMFCCCRNGSFRIKNQQENNKNNQAKLDAFHNLHSYGLANVVCLLDGGKVFNPVHNLFPCMSHFDLYVSEE